MCTTPSNSYLYASRKCYVMFEKDVSNAACKLQIKEPKVIAPKRDIINPSLQN